MGVFNARTHFTMCDDVKIHAWVSASDFDKTGFSGPQEADLQTEVCVFLLYFFMVCRCPMRTNQIT